MKQHPPFVSWDTHRRTLARLRAAEERVDIATRALNEIDYYDRGHPAAGIVARNALAKMAALAADQGSEE